MMTKKRLTSIDRRWRRERLAHMAIDSASRYACESGKCPVCKSRPVRFGITCGELVCVHKWLKIPMPEAKQATTVQQRPKSQVNTGTLRPSLFDKPQAKGRLRSMVIPTDAPPVDLGDVLASFDKHPPQEGQVISDEAKQLVIAFYDFTGTPVPDTDQGIAVALHRLRLSSGTLDQQATSRKAMRALGF